MNTIAAPAETITTQCIKQQVIDLLHWTEEQYGQFQYDMGIDYLLSVLLGGDDTWLDEMTRTKLFWKWWINQWNIRDHEFMQNVAAVTNGHHALAVDMYMGSNEPQYLHCRPHKCVMENTYAVMMQHFIDEINTTTCKSI